MHVPDGLNEELAKMKNKVSQLNAKYKGVLTNTLKQYILKQLTYEHTFT